MEHESEVILIIISVLVTVTKGLIMGLEYLERRGRVETKQIALLKSARILRRDLESWGDLLSLKLYWCEKLSIADFVVPADHKLKLIEIEKRDKYLDLARELKNYGTWR